MTNYEGESCYNRLCQTGGEAAGSRIYAVPGRDISSKFFDECLRSHADREDDEANLQGRTDCGGRSSRGAVGLRRNFSAAFFSDEGGPYLRACELTHGLSGFQGETSGQTVKRNGGTVPDSRSYGRRAGACQGPFRQSVQL